MGKFEITISPQFKKEFNKLEKRIQERVRKILIRLENDHYGEPLKHTLKGFYSVHFNRNHYRLIYQKFDGKIQILAVHVGPRKNDLYTKLKRDVKRGKYSKEF